MELICPECKSSKIYMSAYLVWSCDKQSWVIDEAEGMADGETYCANCFNQSFEPEEKQSKSERGNSSWLHKNSTTRSPIVTPKTCTPR